MVVILHEADRQAPHIRVVLAVVRHSLLLQLSGPWLERQRITTSCDFKELRDRRRVRIRRRRWRWCWRGTAASTAATKNNFPDAGEIGLTVRRPRCGGRQVGLAISQPRYVGRRVFGPLCGNSRGHDRDQDTEDNLADHRSHS